MIITDKFGRVTADKFSLNISGVEYQFSETKNGLEIMKYNFKDPTEKICVIPDTANKIFIK